MTSVDLNSWLVPIIAAGYLVYAIFRLVLSRKLAKERREYELVIKQRMEDLQKDIQHRSRDLHDSMQMINQEYSQLMKSMNMQQKNAAGELAKRLAKHQNILRRKNQDAAEAPSSDDGIPPELTDESK